MPHTDLVDTDRIDRSLVDEAAVDFVLNAKQHYREQRRQAGYEKVWKEAEESYYNGSRGFYTGSADIRDPILYHMVETVVPKEDKVVFPPDGEWFEATPEDPDNDLQVEQAKQATQLLKKQYRDIGVRGKYIPVYRDKAIYGTVWVKNFWEHKLKKRYKRDENNRRVKVWETQFDNPNFYIPSIWDVYADIRDEDAEGIIIEEATRSFQELWDNRKHEDDNGEEVGIYRNIEKLREIDNPKDMDNNKQQSNEKRQLPRQNSFGPFESKVKTLECWGPIPKWFLTQSQEDKRNKQTEQGLIVISLTGETGDDKARGFVHLITEHPLDHQENPYLPGRYTKLNGRLYGRGLIEPNISLEKENNTIRTQLLDQQSFNLRPKWLMDESAEINPNDLQDVAQQIVRTTDVNALTALRPEDFSASSFAHLNQNKGELQESTGVSPTLAGRPAGSSIERTSAGVSTLVSSGMDRFDLVVTQFEQDILIPQIKQFWMLNQQFLPNGREVKFLGEEMIRVNPRDIVLPRINFIGINSLAEKDFKINTLTSLVQNATQLTQLGIDFVPLFLEQVRLMGFGRMIPEIDQRPTEQDQIEGTPEGEVRKLLLGKDVQINFNDRHEDFIQEYRRVLQSSENIPGPARKRIEEALGQRQAALALKNDPTTLKNLVRGENKQNVTPKRQDTNPSL